MPFFPATVEELDRSPPPSLMRPVYTITETVAGFYGALTVTALSDSSIMRAYVGEGWVPNNAPRGLSFGCLYPAVADYDAAFVARLLQADASPAEATFDNVVDMLDWLERD